MPSANDCDSKLDMEDMDMEGISEKNIAVLRFIVFALCSSIHSLSPSQNFANTVEITEK